MYLHVGNELVVNTRDIIGIFDMDNTTVSRQGRRFLPESQDKGFIKNATDDLPKSYVVTKRNDETRIFVSSYSTQAMARSAQNIHSK